MLYQQHPIDMHAPEETSIDFSKVHLSFGVPRYMYRLCFRAAIAMIKAGFDGEEVACFEHELALWFFLGVLRQRWKDRNRPPSAGKDSGIVGHGLNRCG